MREEENNQKKILVEKLLKQRESINLRIRELPRNPNNDLLLKSHSARRNRLFAIRAALNSKLNPF